MGLTVGNGMVIDHFETFWNTLGQRSCNLPKPTLIHIFRLHNVMKPSGVEPSLEALGHNQNIMLSLFTLVQIGHF